MESFHFSDIKLFIANDDAAEIQEIGSLGKGNATKPVITPLHGLRDATTAFFYKGRPILCDLIRSRRCLEYEKTNNSWISGTAYGFMDRLYPGAGFGIVNRTHNWVAGGRISGEDGFTDSSFVLDVDGFAFKKIFCCVLMSQLPLSQSAEPRTNLPCSYCPALYCTN